LCILGDFGMHILNMFYVAETEGRSRISEGAIQRSGEPSSKDTHCPIIGAD